MLRKTSFGNMQTILENKGKPTIEFLIFEKSGRNHKHKEFESFFVLEGEGTVYYNENIIPISAGDLITIPPRTLHWMEPVEGTMLKGFLWYHDEKINTKN